MSLQAYFEETGFGALSPYERSKRMPDLFGVYLNNPGNAERKAVYDTGNADAQKEVYSEFESGVQQAYPDLFMVEAAPERPFTIKTKNGTVLKGKAAREYADRFENAPAPVAGLPVQLRGLGYDVVHEGRDAIKRPLMDPDTEYFVEAVNQGVITPKDLDEDQLASVLPVLRALTPDKAESFMREERDRLAKLGVNKNSFLAKSAVRGASPSDTMTEKFDEWFGDADTAAKYRRWQQAYPTQSELSSTGGAVGGLMLAGKGYSTAINGVLNPGKAKWIPSMAGWMAADATYSGKLPGFITEYAGLDPESVKGRTVTALEGLGIASALDLPVAAARSVRGMKSEAALNTLIRQLPREQAHEAMRKLQESVNAKAVTGRAEDPIHNPTPMRSRIKEGYRRAREEVQDPWYRIRKLNEELGVGETDDFYQAVRIEQGKAQVKTQELGKEMESTMHKIANAEKAQGFTNGELMRTVGDYLAVRHAPDFNRHVAEATARKVDELTAKAAKGDKSAAAELKALKEDKAFVLEGRASGLSDAEANALRAEIESSELFPQVKEAADELMATHLKTLDILRDGGLISAERHAALRESMPNHVPFQRVMDDMDVDNYLAGAGIDPGRNVSGSGLKKAKGSERQINDIPMNIYAAQRSAIERAERNLSNQKMLSFARKYDPDGEIISITKGEKAPNAVTVMEDGVPVHVAFKDEAMQRAFAYMPKRVNHWALKTALTYNRVLGRLYTGYNPDFMLPNKIRDLQDGVANAYREMGMKGAVGVAKSALDDSMAIVDHLRGINSPRAMAYREMIQEGGSTGGISHMTLGSLQDSFDDLQRRAYSNTREFAHKVDEVIDNINMVFEDSTRLGAYNAAKKAGKSNAEAARIARDISFDPMLRGRSGDLLSAGYLFFNPAIQSARNVAKSLVPTSKAGTARLAVVGGSMLGAQYTADMWNRMITGDPEYREKLDGFSKSKAITFITSVNNDPTAKNRYNMVSIPVGYGLLPVKAYNDEIIKVMHGQGEDPISVASNVAASVMESANPLGGNDLISAATPTMLDTIIEIARNQTSLGNAIRPPHEELNNPRDYAKFFNYQATTPEGQLAIDATRLLYNKTGMDISPANLLHLYSTYTGGPGTTLKNAFAAASAIANGEDLEPRNIPIVRRFYRQVTSEAAEYRTGRDTTLGELARDERTRTTLLNKRGQAIAKDMTEILKGENPGKEMGPYIAGLPESEKTDRELWSYILRRLETNVRGDSPDSKLIRSNFGVENGARAKLYAQMMQDMTPAQRVEFFEREAKAGNLSETVAKQIMSALGSRSSGSQDSSAQ